MATKQAIYHNTSRTLIGREISVYNKNPDLARDSKPEIAVPKRFSWERIMRNKLYEKKENTCISKLYNI